MRIFGGEDSKTVVARPARPDHDFSQRPATVLVGCGVPAFTNIVPNNKDVGIIQVMGPHYCSGVAAVCCDVRPALDWTAACRNGRSMAAGSQSELIWR